MKKNLKNTSAKVLAVALAAGMVATSLPGTVADAKKKVKKPTLGKTSVSITVGKTQKITVKKNKGPKVKKVTIKLTKKQKKIVKITKKTKTYFKVKGLKAGKATLSVKIKAGKKTYTKKLKVTVKAKTTPVNPVNTKPATVTPTPGTTGPAASTPTPSAGTGVNPTSPTPTATPAGPVEKTDITLTYDYSYPAARQVLFADADSGYPSYGIDVRDYAKVIVKVAAAKEIEKDEGWAGKVSLSSTDEGMGMTAYTDGLMVKYFNDMPYEDGVYTFTFDINAANIIKGFEFDDLELVDCIGLQLSGTGDGGPNSYDDIKLKEIQFLLPEAGTETPAPSVTPSGSAATPVPVEETDTTAIGDLSVESISDVTTLKNSKDAEGTDVVRIPFTGNYKRVFFDVSDIDFSNMASIKVTAHVPAQMSFNLWAKDLDTTVDEWYNNSIAGDYPFWNGSSPNRGDDGAPGEEGIETYTFDMSKVSSDSIANIGYLSLGTNAAPGGRDPWATAKYMIYSIEFVQKEVTVTAAAAKSSIEAGETTTITAETKLAGEATEATVTYESDDEAVATVDDQGVVTGVASGTATIIVTATVAGITKPATAEVEITVREKSTDPSVELGLTQGAPATIGTGLTTTLDVTVRNADDAVVSYEFGADDTGTATVETAADGKTATVTGTKAGKVTVTAKFSVDGTDYTSEAVEITVVDPTVAVSAKTLDRVVAGRTIELDAATTNAGDAVVAWSSADEEVATVDDNGVVTGVKAGTVDITATITVGGKEYTDKIEITVVAAVEEDLAIDLSSATALGNGATVSGAAADSITLTYGGAYNQSIKVSVTLPDGVDLSDYYGISLQLADAQDSEGAALSGIYGKNVYVELQGKDADAIVGISSNSTNVQIATPSANAGGTIITDKAITSAFTTDNLANAKATTGTFDIAIGINDLPVGTTYKITNVKLLKEAPAAE